MTNSSIQATPRVSPLDIGLHLVLAPLGLFNLVLTVAYFMRGWGDLHQQGIGHLYLVIASVAASWWLTTAVVLCFAGTLMLAGQNHQPALRRLVYAILGAAVSIVLPQFFVAGWAFISLWVHSFL